MVCDRSIIIKINKVVPMLAFPGPSSNSPSEPRSHIFIGTFAYRLDSGPGVMDAYLRCKRGRCRGIVPGEEWRTKRASNDYKIPLSRCICRARVSTRQQITAAGCPNGVTPRLMISQFSVQRRVPMSTLNLVSSLHRNSHFNVWREPQPISLPPFHLKSITRTDKRLLSTYMHLIESLDIIEPGKQAIDMDSVATAASSAGTSVCEEYNLTDRPAPPQPQSPRPVKRPASPYPEPRHRRALDEGYNVNTGEAPRGRTRDLSVRRKPKYSDLKSATWSNIVLNMPLHSDL